MFKIKCQTEFDMAHYLSGYNGKCSNIHGHRYTLIATFASKTVHENGHLRGMVEDFTTIKAVLKKISDDFDHKLIIEDNDEGHKIKEQLTNHDVVIVNYRPTAEMMSKDIFERLKKENLPIYKVELFETPNNSCIYNED